MLQSRSTLLVLKVEGQLVVVVGLVTTLGV